MPTDQQWVAWAAGLFEGEGWFTADHGKHRFRISAGIQSTDRDVLERFQDVVGCGSLTGPYMAKGSTKPLWTWRVRKAKDLDCLILLFAPYLSERRLARLAELRDLFDNQQPRKRPGPSPYYVLPGQERL